MSSLYANKFSSKLHYIYSFSHQYGRPSMPLGIETNISNRFARHKGDLARHKGDPGRHLPVPSASGQTFVSLGAFHQATPFYLPSHALPRPSPSCLMRPTLRATRPSRSERPTRRTRPTLRLDRLVRRDRRDLGVPALRRDGCGLTVQRYATITRLVSGDTLLAVAA